MYNDWLTIGPITIHGYGFMIAVGILVGFWVMERQARKYGLNESIADNIVYVALVVGYLCSKLTYTIINFNDFLKDPIHFLFNSSGWVVYGGILGGILGAYIYCRMKKVNFMDYFNLIIPFKIYNDNKTRNQTAAWYLILYSIGRFMIEFLRGDVERGFIGFLSTSQMISIVVAIAGVFLLLKQKKETSMIKENEK